jgi:hypothetical protein
MKALFLATIPPVHLRPKARSESQVIHIELTYHHAAQVNSIEVFFNLFNTDVFTAEGLFPCDHNGLAERSLRRPQPQHIGKTRLLKCSLEVGSPQSAIP